MRRRRHADGHGGDDLFTVGHGARRSTAATAATPSRSTTTDGDRAAVHRGGHRRVAGRCRARRRRPASGNWTLTGIENLTRQFRQRRASPATPTPTRSRGAGGDDTLNGGGGDDTLMGDGARRRRRRAATRRSMRFRATSIERFGVVDGNDTLSGGAGERHAHTAAAAATRSTAAPTTTSSTAAPATTR